MVGPAPSRQRVKKALLFLTLILLGQITIGALVIYVVASGEVKSSLDRTIQRAQGDITYENGRWDTSRYDTDPEIPGNYRLYVIAKDGFIIDRWRPIPGYLDTSDFKQLQEYSTPRTLNTATNQEWRVLSLPLHNAAGHTVGVVAIGRLDPRADQLNKIDAELRSAAKKLTDIVKISDSNIDATQVNVRDVPYTYSFLVVDQFNKIHAKSDNSSSIDRLPNYIDPSYIVEHLQSPLSKRLMDSRGKDTFVVRSIPLLDKNNAPFGTVIVARTVTNNVQLFKAYVRFSLLGSIILLLIAGWFIRRKLEQDANTAIQSPAKAKRLALDDIVRISFDKEGNHIVINDHKIALSYASNQYYLCRALFASPKKKWETDELLDRLGEEPDKDNWRKMYDAMNAINKKTNEIIEPRLITSSNKTYRINPLLLEKLKK